MVLHRPVELAALTGKVAPVRPCLKNTTIKRVEHASENQESLCLVTGRWWNLGHYFACVWVRGTIDGHPFKTSFMAMGDGRHMLPVKVEIRRAIGKEVGETVKVLPEERIRT
jgi:hypothetical protein